MSDNEVVNLTRLLSLHVEFIPGTVLGRHAIRTLRPEDLMESGRGASLRRNFPAIKS
jgi:hypothetical protein